METPVTPADPVTCETEGDDIPPDPREGDTVLLVCVRGASEAANRAAFGSLTTTAGPFKAATVARDLAALYATGAYADASAIAAHTTRGLVIRFVVKPRPLVAHIDVRGARAVVPERIGELSGARTGLPYDPAKLREGTLRIASEYGDEGYPFAQVNFNAEPASPANDADATEDIKLTIAIDEGPLVRVGAVALPGAGKAVEADIRKQLVLQPGSVFRGAALERDVLVVSAVCYDHGLLEVKVSEPSKSSSPDRALMNVTIPLVEGPVYRLKAITFIGDVDDEHAYRSMLGLKVGDVFSRATIAAALDKMRERRRLYGKGTEVEPLTELDAKTHKVTVAFRFSPKSVSSPAR